MSRRNISVFLLEDLFISHILLGFFFFFFFCKFPQYILNVLTVKGKQIKIIAINCLKNLNRMPLELLLLLRGLPEKMNGLHSLHFKE